MRGKITRTFTTKKFKVEVYNKTSKEIQEFAVEIDGRTTEKKIEKEIENELGSNFIILNHELVCTIEKLFSMDEAEFLRLATIEKIEERK